MTNGSAGKRLLSLRVNGVMREFAARPNDTLLTVLREDLQLTGTRRGCDTGACGCCTVHVDGRAALSCLILAFEAEGADLVTIEGLRQGEALHPVQKAFEHEGGSQCGFCTSGMIMTSAALLAEQPEPPEDEIRRALGGNLCRCTGYTKIVSAVQRAARELAGQTT